MYIKNLLSQDSKLLSNKILLTYFNLSEPIHKIQFNVRYPECTCNEPKNNFDFPINTMTFTIANLIPFPSIPFVCRVDTSKQMYILKLDWLRILGSWAEAQARMSFVCMSSRRMKDRMPLVEELSWAKNINKPQSCAYQKRIKTLNKHTIKNVSCFRPYQ